MYMYVQNFMIGQVKKMCLFSVIIVPLNGYDVSKQSAYQAVILCSIKC